MTEKKKNGDRQPRERVSSIDKPKNLLQNQQERVSLKRTTKERITVQISVEVIDRLKNAVYWTPGLTLTSLAEDALIIAIDKLEKMRKEPFPKRREELKTGRPIS